MIMHSKEMNIETDEMKHGDLSLWIGWDKVIWNSKNILII